MHSKTLPKTTAKLLNKIRGAEFLKNFYLSGGTALSLQLGHRESEDLDFFNKKFFNSLLLQQDIAKFGQLEDVQVSKGTLNLYLLEVKLQFLYYPYQLLEPTLKWKGINFSSVVDIGCTKLQTVSMRGSKKDFIDLYMIFKKYPLENLLARLNEKYKGVDYNLHHILKSLVYFADAENQPMPRMHADIKWSEVKNELTKVVKDFAI
ncbi:nucleotidyl transferase AbiEii/AbiGii toxin family protein [Patescibacteria group bacterium]|nr:nucleotidyl transferase AbiEii/AbiGii toxin family protein [Patescibacteria group bacterium]